jgi:ATP-dependent DNA helicase DinG
MQELDEIFGGDGPLGRALPGFRPRRQQALMAARIAAALQTRETLIVEAGTGTGKTFAYLVPALISGLRVLISTGTRTLQDQLFSKDLPLVGAALGRPARVALLKGRANYLCLQRLSRALETHTGGGAQLTLEGLEEARMEPDVSVMLTLLARWSRTTRSGDLAEVAGLSDSHPVWPQVTSTRESCLSSQCPELARCHVALARREAQEADIVIVNHHLLLADLALKEEGFADLLGSADALVIDEAHQLPDLATQHFGVLLTSRQMEMLLAEVEQEVRAHELGVSPASLAGAAARRALEAARDVRDCLAALAGVLPGAPGRFAWGELPAVVSARAHELGESLDLLADRLGGLEAEGLPVPLRSRVDARLAELTQLAAADDTEGSRVIEVTARGFALHLTPFDISARFRAIREARRASWIFTSATLSVGEDFSHFASRLGLDGEPALRIGSPFDYERQGLVYLPRGLPAPAARDYPAAVIDTALPLIEASGGGAFVLFTSHRSLREAARCLRERWGSAPPHALFVQGEAPRERQLAAFREDGSAVLLGTASFWEGVDVQGEALRLVIIEKLPFASPEEPLVRARIEHLRATGADPFRDYQLPAAVLALKQGVGRLIRSEDAHGAVVICDPRMHGRGYGKVFLAALPPMSVTLELAEVVRFLRRHAPARASSPGARATGAL